MADPASEESQREFERALMAVAGALSTAVLSVLARRLKRALSGDGISSLYKAYPQDMLEIDNLLRKGESQIRQQVRTTMRKATTDNDRWAERYYGARGVEQVAWEDHGTLSEVEREHEGEAEAAVAAALGSLALVGPDGSLVGFEDGYRSVLSHVASWPDDLKRAAVVAVVTALARHGLRHERPDGGSDRLETAVSGTVMGSYRGLIEQLRHVQGIEFGADGVQLSAHGDSAPDHVPYQGGRFTYESFERIQADLPREYVTGAGCRHFTWPVVIGVDRPAYSDDELEAMYRSSTGEVSFTGLSGRTLTKTGYEASQYRRSVERRCRELSTRLELMRQSGLEDAVEPVRQELSRVRDYYSELCRETGAEPLDWRTRAHTMR